MRLLHEVVADIEQEAVSEGYTKAKGFAGGSCKELFCGTYTDCNVLERKSECRNPGLSRPSWFNSGRIKKWLSDMVFTITYNTEGKPFTGEFEVK
jgi:predicted metal-binding protein